MPDRFEAGTMNLPGIVGLHAGLLWINNTGLHNIEKHELELTRLLLDELKPLEESGELMIAGKHSLEGRTGVISIQVL